MILLIDNYDSFTHNLAHLISEAAPGRRLVVLRNDAVSVSEVLELNPEALVLSPGPGSPTEAGIVPELLDRWPTSKPLLGVCLGHQALGQRFGAHLVRVAPWHGKTSRIAHRGEGVFASLPVEFEAMRYHSLALDRRTILDPLRVTAWVASDETLVMGVRVEGSPWEGVQFHPESYRSEHGILLLRRFFDGEDETRSAWRL